jgi:hypothetical protein
MTKMMKKKKKKRTKNPKTIKIKEIIILNIKK